MTVFFTLFIVSILMELNCPFMTPTNTPLTYADTVLHGASGK